jgi:parallel beta-helix repeat protein
MKRTIMSYMVATIVSFAAIGALALQPLPIMAQSAKDDSGTTTGVACGEVVSGTVNLTSNLVCSGDGLIIGKDNTVVNLNGHNIVGPGTGSSKVGFMIPNTDDVTIQGPGTVEQFQAGLLITGSNNVKVKSLILENNEIGIFTTGSDGAQVQKNIIDSNNIGFASHSSDGVKVDTNIMTNNPLAAITLVNTHKADITVNTAEGSQNGIFIDQQSTDNKISDNNAMKNIIDLNNANGMPPNINSNTFDGNRCDVSTPSGLCSGK